MELRVRDLPIKDSSVVLFSSAESCTVGGGLADFLLSGICSQLELFGEEAEAVKAKNPAIPEVFPAGWLKSFRGAFSVDDLVYGGLVSLEGSNAKLTGNAIQMLEKAARKHKKRAKKHHS